MTAAVIAAAMTLAVLWWASDRAAHRRREGYRAVLRAIVRRDALGLAGAHVEMDYDVARALLVKMERGGWVVIARGDPWDVRLTDAGRLYLDALDEDAEEPE